MGDVGGMLNVQEMERNVERVQFVNVCVTGNACPTALTSPRRLVS